MAKRARLSHGHLFNRFSDSTPIKNGRGGDPAVPPSSAGRLRCQRCQRHPVADDQCRAFQLDKVALL
jgi:hypothetical protein